MVLKKIDAAICKVLDRYLPENLTIRYIWALTMIALLALFGQVLIQYSIGKQLNSQLVVRTLDREVVTIDELKKSALILQLSSSTSEGLRQFQSIEHLLDELVRDNQTLEQNGSLRNYAQLEAPFRKILVATKALEGEFIKAKANRHQLRSSVLLPNLRQVIEASVLYRDILKNTAQEVVQNLEHQMTTFKRTELALFFATILVLLIEALYIFRPAVTKLYEALRTRSEFLSRMSHELRNPMNSILGMAELLSETNITDQQKNYLSILRRSGNSLLEILNSLLDFSSIETRRIKLERVQFDLYDVVQKCIELSVIVAYANETELVLKLDEDVPLRVWGDPIRLQQVLSNLLGNAVKFTQKGSVTLSISNCKMNDKDCIRFAVSDTGIGIDKERVERIFEPFVQEDSSIRRRYGGSGLGLTIAKDIVNRMGSKLEVSSEKDKGSEFSFILPLDFEPNSSIQSFLSHTAIPSFEAMIFEPNHEVRDVVSSIFSKCGGKILKAESLSNVVSYLGENRKRFVILDFEAVKKQPDYKSFLREYSDCKVIFLVKVMASNSEIETILAFKNGGFVFKPVRPIHLFDAVVSVYFKDVVQLASVPTRMAVSPQPKIVERPLKILIADDSSDNQVLIQHYLQATPYQLTFVDNGKKALEQAKKESFDLIVMDIEMPEMDGYAATREIRAWEKNEKKNATPILGLSAYTTDSSARTSGFTGYLVKPVTSAEIQKAIYSLANVDTNERRTGIVKQMEKRMRDLAPNYLENRKKEMIELRKALEVSDFKMLESTGHKLKGNALSFGFAEMGEVGAKLEQAAKKSDAALTRALVDELDALITKATVNLLS